jgi:hypothetical protein
MSVFITVISFPSSPKHRGSNQFYLLQGDSKLLDVTEGDAFLGVVIKNDNINMDHILSGYGIMAVF